METLTIHSHMAGFRVIKRISMISSKAIQGESEFHGTPLYAGMEAMAQLATLHVREQLQFDRHAFLLKVNHCRMPKAEVLTGCFRITADLCSRSSNAFRYDTGAQGPDGVGFKGDLLIGTRNYDEQFSKDLIKAHYQGLLNKLKRIMAC